jgi:hypothetical protein
MKRMEEQRKANRKSYRENLKVYLQRKEDDLKEPKPKFKKIYEGKQQILTINRAHSGGIRYDA